MFRCLSAILLVFAFAVQSFNGVFIVLNYYANTTSYSKDCVNKFRPQMHCEGKCVMMKKMIEAEKKDQQAPQLKLDMKNGVYTSNNIGNLVADPVLQDQPKYFTVRSSKSSSGFLQSIFHPPGI